MVAYSFRTVERCGILFFILNSSLKILNVGIDKELFPSFIFNVTVLNTNKNLYDILSKKKLKKTKFNKFLWQDF